MRQQILEQQVEELLAILCYFDTVHPSTMTDYQRSTYSRILAYKEKRNDYATSSMGR